MGKVIRVDFIKRTKESIKVKRLRFLQKVLRMYRRIF